MEKKLTTIKEYLENRIKTLNKSINECGLHDDYEGEDRFRIMLEEVEDVLKVYNQQCEDILEAVGISQERIKEHLGYTDRKCIEFAEWLNCSYSTQGQGIWRLDESDLVYNTEELYNEYTAQRGETSTEGPGTS